MEIQLSPGTKEIISVVTLPFWTPPSIAINGGGPFGLTVAFAILGVGSFFGIPYLLSKKYPNALKTALVVWLAGMAIATVVLLVQKQDKPSPKGKLDYGEKA